MSIKANYSYPIYELLQKRWSPRAILPKIPTEDQLRLLFEAARWVPSCFNEQPWRFFVGVKDRDKTYQKIFNSLAETNQVWAQQAPVLAVSVAKLHFTYNQKPNRHGIHDVGLAVENLVIQATALGLAVHQMAGFNQKQIEKDLAIPQGYEAKAVLAIDYEGDANQLPEKLAEREKEPRTRKKLEELETPSDRVPVASHGEKISNTC